ncbi:MAG: G5 domain-containing protein [Anaerolineales bacterium]|nr:G5 domain-containing protein [Anaerolineales bacterium]
MPRVRLWFDLRLIARLAGRLVGYLTMAALLVTGCRPVISAPPTAPSAIHLTILVDGDVQTYSFEAGLTVREAVATAGITLGELDQVSPAPFTVISNGLAIVITRVSERFETETVQIPFASEIVHNEGLPAGERRLLQVGQVGTEELTYRTVFEDGVQVSRSVVRRVTLTSPVSEIIMVGQQGSFTLVPISGTLAYINGRNAWVMRGNSGQRLPLTTSGDLDGKVFELSPDGRWLLFSREVTASNAGNFNTLWIVATTPVTTTRPTTTTTPALPFTLPVSNALYAEWSPIDARTLIYSTAERISRAPGWQANNDLWLLRWAPRAGNRQTFTTTQILDSSAGGLYGWWGTGFAFAPDGRSLAYSRADSIGLLSFSFRSARAITATVVISELVQFTAYNTHSDWAWYPPMRWAPNGTALYTITHGGPIGLEAPEDSPAFDLGAVSVPSGRQYTLIPRAGMFANPQPSPERVLPSGEVSYRIAFLQATDPNNSPFSNYRLGLMDRDGSNTRFVFPPEGQSGLSPNEQIAWSPSGDRLALIYQGNVWVIDPDTGLNQQLTGDGLSAEPRWSQ